MFYWSVDSLSFLTFDVIITSDVISVAVLRSVLQMFVLFWGHFNWWWILTYKSSLGWLGFCPQNKQTAIVWNLCSYFNKDSIASNYNEHELHEVLIYEGFKFVKFVKKKVKSVGQQEKHYWACAVEARNLFWLMCSVSSCHSGEWTPLWSLTSSSSAPSIDELNAETGKWWHVFQVDPATKRWPQQDTAFRTELVLQL